MSEIQQGLLITAIGMGLVFVVIIFLWGLMAYMMRLTSEKDEVSEAVSSDVETDIPAVPEMAAAESQRRAAAAAVAVLMAITAGRDRATQMSTQGDAWGMNPWQSFHRERQLENRQIRG